LINLYPPYEPACRLICRGALAQARIRAILLLAVSSVLIFVLLRQRSERTPRPPETAPEEPRALTRRGDLASDEQSTIDLFREVSPTFVQVTSANVQRGRVSLKVFEIPQGTGSGFLWDTSGHVVTNFHVIRGGTRAEVALYDSTVWRAKIIGAEPDKDLAVLKIEAPPEKLRAIGIGSSADLQVGQKVFAISNPFGLDQTLTTGVISGLNREIKSLTGRPMGVIQTHAAITPDNSGPLLDSAGRLVGVNTAIDSPSRAYAGIGFAVPVDTVNRIVPQLIAHGKVVRPGLGIIATQASIVRQLKLEGVLVHRVPRGSAADEAGLVGMSQGQRGVILGDLIVGIDGQPMYELNDLYRELDKHSVGDVVVLDVIRGGEKRKVTLTLQALP
jgi:S1-C subfamily serine protease